MKRAIEKDFGQRFEILADHLGGRGSFATLGAQVGLFLSLERDFR